MEQGVTSDDTVFMRYKYSAFFDLNPKVKSPFNYLFILCASVIKYKDSKTCQTPIILLNSRTCFTVISVSDLYILTYKVYVV